MLYIMKSDASYYLMVDHSVALNSRRPATAQILQRCAERKIVLAYGDIINFGEDRQKYSYIYVGPDAGDFIKNPDSSGSGYLTIPLAVTKNLPDSIKYYAKVIRKLGVELEDIELGHDDATIQAIFKQPSDILAKAIFAYSPLEKMLYVEVGRRSQAFPVNTKQTDIERAFTTDTVTVPKKSLFSRIKTMLKKKK